MALGAGFRGAQASSPQIKLETKGTFFQVRGYTEIYKIDDHQHLWKIAGPAQDLGQ